MPPSHLIRPHAASSALLAAALACTPAVARADESADGVVARQIEALAEQVKAQQAEIERLRAQVEDMQLAQMRGRGTEAGASVAAAAAQAATPPVTPATPANPTDPQRTPLAAQATQPLQVGEARREEDAARREQDRALVVREHAPLFDRRFTIDSGITYTYYDRRALSLSGFLALDAIFLGTINIDQSKASIATFDVTGRYGLTDRLSIEANVPYVFRDTRFVSGGAGGAANVVSEVETSSGGIGDVSAAVYYQLVKESARWPDVVTSLRVRAPTGREPFGIKLIQPDTQNTNLNVPEDLPTGSGVWSATANVSVLRTYDPVILFANLGYTYHVPTDFDDISPFFGVVNPAEVSLGNIWQLSTGLAVALNDRTALSLSVASAFQAATHTLAPDAEDDRPVRVPGSGSNSTSLNIGASYLLPSGWTFNGQLAAGLTPDAPNFVFGFRTTKSF